MLRRLFRRWSRAAAEEVERTVGPGAVVFEEEGANFFGVESRGKAQVRGNGHLALTADEIVFVMWVGSRRLRIPRSAITSVHRKRSHLGKTVFRDLLAVSFTNDSGAPDTAAWLVRDLPAWEAALAR